MEKRLYRSRRDSMVGGVCAGLADYYGLDVTIVRLAAAAIVLFTSGAGVLAYVLLWVLVPEEPVEGSIVMSDTTPVPVPEPAPEPAEQPPAAATAPTYSAPTYIPVEQPAPPVPPAPPAPQAPPAYVPQPVTASEGAQEARRGGVMGGIILIVLGGIFLVSQFVPGIDIGKLWPLILIAIGIGIIVRRR